MGIRRTRAIGFAVAWLVAACSPVSQPSATPSTSAPQTQAPHQTPVPGRTPSARPSSSLTAAQIGCAERLPPRVPLGPDPTAVPPPPQPSIPDPDPDAAVARTIGDAVARLDALGSYRFTSTVAGRSFWDLREATTFDFGMEATITQRDGLALKGVIGSRIREPDGSAATSGGQEVLFGGGWAWGASNVSGVLEPTPQAQLGPFLELAAAATLRRHVLPFASGFRRVGSDQHAGVPTTHYRATAATRRAIATFAKFDGDLKADVWIAVAGGWLAGAEISGTKLGPGGRTTDFVFVQVEVSHPDDPADVITLPALPVPEPVRATGDPVHLRLTYAVGLGPGGQVTTDAERSEMGVTMRVRLDVAQRQVTVDEQSGGRLIVTSCFTTEPDRDRALTSEVGALTVVPLPADRYGTDASPGRDPLPAAGDPIDPSLPPIAPADRVDAAVHVDPTTGQRGVAFRLAYQASEVYRPWAKAHAGEWIAIVFDGKVLGVQAVRDRVADGMFAFTGDYTTAETERLRDLLQRPPLSSPLRIVEDVEIPA